MNALDPIRPTLLAFLLAAAFLAPSRAHAQADFFEGFNNIGDVPPGEQGPEVLLDQGWTFVNHSEPVGAWAWYESDPGAFPSFEGPTHIISSRLATGFGGTPSSWMIPPAISGLQDGDIVSFYVRAQQDPSAGQRLELRYSPSGGIDTGSGLDGTGDFTMALLVLDPPPQDQEFWTRVTATVPGAGRLAFWYRSGTLPAQVEVDAFGINQDVEGPPLPGPGETVTWMMADSPFILDSTVVIPEGGTLEVEPGVEITVQSGGSLVVLGNLIAHGTGENPIHISGVFSQVTPPVRVYGTADIAFAEVIGLIMGESGGHIQVADSQFPAGEVFTREGVANSFPTVVRIDRCNFTNGGCVYVVDGTLAIRDSTFEDDASPLPPDGSLRLLRGYLYVDDVMIDGGILSYIREGYAQSAHINNVSVVNSPDQAAIEFSGWNCVLGEDNVLQNNLYPLSLEGGIVPGSVLPLTGNINNYITASPFGSSIWPDLGLPYVIDGVQPVAISWTLMPGTTVQFTPSSGLQIPGSAYMQFHSLPDNPVVFQRFDPAEPWSGILFHSGGPNLIENAVFEGSDIGVIASDADITLQNCLLQNNSIGSNSNTFAVTEIRKTRIFDNGIGAQGSAAPVSNGEPDLFGFTNPNWIEGNGVGVQGLNPSDEIEARYNYWGSPTGPTSPTNPGGTGDSEEGFVTYSPFLTAPPDFNDHPPMVRMINPFTYAETGDKSIITWDVTEDGSIVSQRALFTPAFGHPFQVLADDLPPDQRSLEFTVPMGNPGGGPNGPALIKVEATDNAGQIGWDHVRFRLPNLEGLPPTEYFFTMAPSGTIRPGEEIPLCWDHTGLSSTVSLILVLDSDGTTVGLGGTTTDCFEVVFPYVSTDQARVAVVPNLSTLAQPFFFSDTFAIRPDPLIGDEPPIVTLLTPSGGETFSGGGIVPVTWAASDDEALRSIDIQASYDGGRGWHFVARDLPGSTSSYDWRLPASEGVSDVRLRVVARDLRFQNSSDTSDPFEVLSGSGVQGDADGDGDVDLDDHAVFVGCLTGPDESGIPTGCQTFNFDGDNDVDLFDFSSLQSVFTGN
jgi:hypothetical protein